MGKALLIFVLGFSTIFGTIALNLNRHSLESVDNYSNHFQKMTARNCATSGVYMALSKLSLDPTHTWRDGFPEELPLSGGNFTVDVQDHSENPALSNMEVRIISTGSYDDVSKTIDLRVGIPPNLADLAVFCTGYINEVTVYDENRDEDPSLAITNAPEMLPFDKDALVNLAISQDGSPPHVHNSNFDATDNYPNGNFYYNIASQVPNVIWVKGDFTVVGGITCYGIYVVEGNAILHGSARLEGVIYIPNPGSIVITGGGNPNESSITGGVFANGYIDGTGNHISIQYEPEYMASFGEFQIQKNMFIISWKESSDL